MVRGCIIYIYTNVSTKFLNAEEKKLLPGTVGYGEISLVVSTQGLIMAKVKDCKAAARLLPPKAESHNQPRVEANIFDEHDEHCGSDHNSSPSMSDQLTSNPYKVVQTTRVNNNLVTNTDLDCLTAFDQSDLLEIALVDDATSYSVWNTLRYGQKHHPDSHHHCSQREELAVQYTTQAYLDQNTNVRQGSKRRTKTHEHYKVPHRGDLGGNQYHQLVVDIPKETKEVPAMMRAVPQQAKSTGEFALPISKAQIGVASHTHAGQGPVQLSNFYAQQLSSRTLLPTHPANRIPPPGQRFSKGKERAHIHAAQSNFPSHVRQEQDEQTHYQPQEHNDAYRFVYQRLLQDGQAGPSREVFLTRDEEMRARHSFEEDAYMHAVYEDEEEES